MSDIFGSLLGGIFIDPLSQNTCNPYRETQAQEQCVMFYQDGAIESKPYYKTEENTGLVIDGECEDITDKRALPKLEEE